MSALFIAHENHILHVVLIVLPYRQNIGEAFVFMDDNSRSNRAHVVNDFLQDNYITRLEWPDVLQT